MFGAENEVTMVAESVARERVDPKFASSRAASENGRQDHRAGCIGHGSWRINFDEIKHSRPTLMCINIHKALHLT